MGGNCIAVKFVRTFVRTSDIFTVFVTMEEHVIEPRVRVNGGALARHVGRPVSIMGTVLNVSLT